MIGFAGIWNKEREWNPTHDATIEGMLSNLQGQKHSALEVITLKVNGVTRAKIGFLLTAQNPTIVENEATRLVVYGSIYNDASVESILNQVLDAWQNPQRAVLLLNGDFTLFAFNKLSGELAIYRDRGGVRHVFYHEASHGLAFASGLRAVAKADIYQNKLPNYDAIWLNMAYPAPPQPLTCFENIHCLERGSALKLKASGISTARYWEVPSNQIDGSMNFEEAVSGLHQVLDTSIQRRVIGLDKISSTLSGGVDSAYLTALSYQHNSATEAITFKIKGSDFDHLNEDSVASLTAKKYGIPHHIHAFEFDEFFSQLNLLVKLYEQPGLSLGAYFAIAQLTSQLGHTNLINGLAADELHGGFHYFKHLGYWSWLRLLQPLAFLAPSNRHKGIDKFKRIAGSKDIHAYYARSFAQHLDREIAAMMPGHHVDSSMVQEKLYAPSHSFDDDVTGLMHYMFSNCPNHHLYRFETFCNHFGIRAIYPFLDNDVIDFSWQIPSRHKVIGHRRKIALKKAAEPWVVKPALTEAKRGVGAPVNHWINQELKAITHAKLDALKQRDAFSPQYIDQVAKQHRMGYGKKAWKLVMTELWFEEFID